MSIFERIVCGVDGSSEGLEALRQAKRLLEPGGRLLAATVHDPSRAVRAGFQAAAIVEELRRQAEEASAAAERELAGVEHGSAVMLEGPAPRRLLTLLEEEGATLVAVGSRGGSRAAGILLGSVATTLLHEAACAVLVARPADDAEAFPRAVVVGVDGSAESLAAHAAAAALAERFGASLRAVAATGGKPVDTDGLVAIEGIEWVDGPPLDALVAASGQADLVVVGSRGLHGVGALGSVSERIGHRAVCSALVVRSGD